MEQRAKLNSLTFALSSGGKNNQAVMQCLSPGCTRCTLCRSRPCAMFMVPGHLASRWPVLPETRWAHTTWPVVTLVAFVREHKGVRCPALIGRNTLHYQNNWMLYHPFRDLPETQSHKKTKHNVISKIIWLISLDNTWRPQSCCPGYTPLFLTKYFWSIWWHCYPSTDLVPALD